MRADICTGFGGQNKHCPYKGTKECVRSGSGIAKVCVWRGAVITKVFARGWKRHRKRVRGKGKRNIKKVRGVSHDTPLFFMAFIIVSDRWFRKVFLLDRTYRLFPTFFFRSKSRSGKIFLSLLRSSCSFLPIHSVLFLNFQNPKPFPLSSFHPSFHLVCSKDLFFDFFWNLSLTRSKKFFQNFLFEKFFFKIVLDFVPSWMRFEGFRAIKCDTRRNNLVTSHLWHFSRSASAHETNRLWKEFLSSYARFFRNYNLPIGGRHFFWDISFLQRILGFNSVSESSTDKTFRFFVQTMYPFGNYPLIGKCNLADPFCSISGRRVGYFLVVPTL